MKIRRLSLMLRYAVLSLAMVPYIWAQFAGGSGTPADPYRIATAAQLEAVRTNLAASYLLTANIDLDQVPFAPLGGDAEPFAGQFNGNGHSISNWSFGDANANVGLFVHVGESGRIEHLTLANCHVTAASYGAGLLAVYNDGVIDDCSVSGSVAGVTLAGNVGGLAGMSGGVVTSSHANVSITAPPSQYFSGACGGLIGSAFGVVRDCSASGTIARTPNQVAPPTGGLVGIGGGVIERCTAAGSVEGSVYTGGFVGLEYNRTAISKCHATGPVSGQGYAVGGFAGIALGFIGDSYATGTVTCMNGEAAGFVGYLGSGEQLPGFVERSYAIGAVTSFDPFNERGFVSNTWHTSVLTECYWDVDTTGTALTFRDIGADFDIGAFGLTTSQMQDPATYAAWDSARVWIVSSGQYPTLRTDGLALPAIVTQPQDQSVAVAQPVQLSVVATSEGPLTYQWFHDDVLVPGATAAVLTIPSAQASDMGAYTVKVRNSVGPAFSYGAYLDVISPPTITEQPTSQTAAVGESATLWVQASGSSSLAYQWNKNGAPISGATDYMYFIPSVSESDAGTYTVTVSNELGSVTSASAILTVVPPEPVITQQPQGQSTTLGGEVTFTVAATGAAGLNFQWYRNGEAIPGAYDRTLVVSNVTFAESGTYTVNVSNYAGSVTSNAVQLTVLAAPSVNWLYPFSTTAGGPALEFWVTGYGFMPGAQILWNGTALPTVRRDLFTLITTIPASYLATTSELTTVQIAAQNPGGYVSNPVPFLIESAVVTSASTGVAGANGTASATATSTTADPVVVSADLQHSGTAAATLSVATYSTNPTSVPTVDVGGQYVDVQIIGATSADVATSHFYYPASITGTAETDLVLSYFDGTAWHPVLSSGGVAPQKDTTDGVLGVPYGGTFTVIFDSTSMPRVTELTGTVFTVGLSAAGVAKKNAAKQKPKITADPVDVKVATGQDATFSVTATSALPVTYQWHFDGKKSGDIPGATSSTLTLRNVTSADAGTYSVTVTNANGSTTSKKASLTVSPKK